MYKLTEEDYQFSRLCFVAIGFSNNTELDEEQRIEFFLNYVMNNNEKFVEIKNFSQNLIFLRGMMKMLIGKSDYPDREDGSRLTPSLRGRLGGICKYCGVEANSVDHIWPIALGGPPDYREDMWNFAASCSYCNRLKGFAPLSCTANENFIEKFTRYCERQATLGD